MIKPILSLLSTACVFVLLSGCGGGGGDDVAADTPALAADAGTPIDAAATEVDPGANPTISTADVPGLEEAVRAAFAAAAAGLWRLRGTQRAADVVGSNGRVNHGHGEVAPTSSADPAPAPSGQPCSGANRKVHEGSLVAGRYATQPGDRGLQRAGGLLKGWLKGPSGANFGLILCK